MGSKSEAENPAWLYLGGLWPPDQKLHKIEAQSIHTSPSLEQKVYTRFAEFKISHCWHHLVIAIW